MTVRNIESFDCAPFDRLRAGRTGIEQGISNYEVEIASSAIGGLAMTPHQITPH